jgi:hypothetical protein
MELTKPPSGNRVQDIEAGWKLAFRPAFIDRRPDLLNRLRENALAYPECPPYARQLQRVWFPAPASSSILAVGIAFWRKVASK